MFIGFTIDENALWSGAIGSLISAALSLLTALLVLWLTHRYRKRERENERIVRSIADVVASTQEIALMRSKQDSSDFRFRMDSALTRLRLSHPGGENLFSTLKEWPRYLVLLKKTIIDGDMSIAAYTEPYEPFTTAILVLQNRLPDWVTSNKKLRAGIRQELDIETRKLQDIADEIIELHI